MADYKPGDEPLAETDNRKFFCKFHYKGVLILLIPLAFGGLLAGKPVLVSSSLQTYLNIIYKNHLQMCRFLYLTICLYLFYILNLMARGAVAFIYIVFIPIAGIAGSDPVSFAHYPDLMFLVYGTIMMGAVMDSSRLSEYLGFVVIRIVGANIFVLQLYLAAGVFFIAFVANPTAAAAFWISVAQAVLTEYDKAGVLKMHSDEARFEIGSPEYPTFPVVGIYLTLCYIATLAGAVSPIVNPNGQIVDAFLGEVNIPQIMLIMVVPVILGICVTLLWIQIVFLGLLGGPIKREMNKLAENVNGFDEAVAERKLALGPWKVHPILSFAFIILTFIIMHTRKPRIYSGWEDISPSIWGGYSVQSLGLVIFFFAIPANYLFCRYYACREPENPGTAPSLLAWKSINKLTPWGDILMLGASFCCVFCAKESGFYKAVADAASEPSGGFLQFLYGACYGTLFTNLSPATRLAKVALPVMLSAGKNFALPFASALHNQFLLPTGAPSNTIVSGMGNVRPFLFV
ncbi:hypothetical protein KR054_006275, partial [Drosophila jambulina]